MDKDQATTPGTTCPTLYDECVGSLTSPASHYSEDAGVGAYSLSSLSEKTRISNHLQMSLQRQCWSGLGLEPETFRTVVRRSTNWSAVNNIYKHY